MTEKKLCPFMSQVTRDGPLPVLCYEELCMAWMLEKKEVHDPTVPGIIDIPGHCRLIP
jgi:hypothetical protein